MYLYIYIYIIHIHIIRNIYHIVYTNIREKMARAILGAPVFGIWGRAFECISIHSIITTLEASTHQGEVCPGLLYPTNPGRHNMGSGIMLARDLAVSAHLHLGEVHCGNAPL